MLGADWLTLPRHRVSLAQVRTLDRSSRSGVRSKKLAPELFAPRSDVPEAGTPIAVALIQATSCPQRL